MLPAMDAAGGVVDDIEMRRRVAAARVARLATIDADGRPHLVPCVVALHHNTLYTPVDPKPKRTRRLRRLENIERDPRVTLLVDEYDEDWSVLWWVRLRGVARILDGDGEWKRAAELLRAKYQQYRGLAATDLRPIIAVDVEEWSGWWALPPGAPAV